MFESHSSEIELSEQEFLSGERDDQLAYLATIETLADGWTADGRDVLPPIEHIHTGPFLAVLLEYYDRQNLNGHDVVRLLKARERQIAHSQAQSMADSVETSYAASGDSESDVERLEEQFEYGADEIRAALTLTRRAAEYRLTFATDICERLPGVWRMLNEGVIDVGRARVFGDGTAHVPEAVAHEVVERLADVASKLTAGQLRYRISKLCMSVDPDDAEKREHYAREDRRLVIEPTVDGTANVHLLDITLADAKAIGRRVNAHMISLKSEDRSGRSHDQLRVDIARDLLLGGDATNGGRGRVDIRVPVSTLDDGTEPAEIPGMGPVTAETARHIVATAPDAEHQITLVDEDGRPTRIYTLSRRATKKIRRHMETLQPNCSFPGCLAPAADCDYDHLVPWADGGETSTTNNGPKCDHDHTLRDHGWIHQQIEHCDVWVSPLGHTYFTHPP